MIIEKGVDVYVESFASVLDFTLVQCLILGFSTAKCNWLSSSVRVPKAVAGNSHSKRNEATDAAYTIAQGIRTFDRARAELACSSWCSFASKRHYARQDCACSSRMLSMSEHGISTCALSFGDWHTAEVSRRSHRFSLVLLLPLRPSTTLVLQHEQRAGESDAHASCGHEAHPDDVGPEQALLQQAHGAEVAVGAVRHTQAAAAHKHRRGNLGVAVLQLK